MQISRHAVFQLFFVFLDVFAQLGQLAVEIGVFSLKRLALVLHFIPLREYFFVLLVQLLQLFRRGL